MSMRSVLSAFLDQGHNITAKTLNFKVQRLKNFKEGVYEMETVKKALFQAFETSLCEYIFFPIMESKP